MDIGILFFVGVFCGFGDHMWLCSGDTPGFVLRNDFFWLVGNTYGVEESNPGLPHANQMLSPSTIALAPVVILKVISLW